ncbi:TniQ family protein [Thiomonas intermedia]|uniref:TniQ family protein n=1 Tax=Thiomonas intermedia TaxID=926 RepID=UPI0009A55068|nr:TniQ family protein [Thiomonas intermedia]
MIPSFPDGATIASIQTALVALGRFKSLDSSRATIYGIRVVPENKFGLLAELFAQNALDGAVTGSDLIECHTAFPIYASLLADESKHLWKAAQLEGRPGAWARYFPAIVHDDVFAGAPRCCPACVEADREAFGIAYWRVQHQLPSVLVCNGHGNVLHDHCVECASTYPSGGQGQLPSMACTHCGGTQSAAMRKVKDSPGARAQAPCASRGSARTPH